MWGIFSLSNMRIPHFDLTETNELKASEKKLLSSLNNLLKALNDKNLSTQSLTIINQEIDLIHKIIKDGKGLKVQILKSQNKILKQIEKEENLVPKNHYQRLWLVLGMSAFGIPIGVLFGIATGNMGLLGIGLAIGMPIGLIYGNRLDKKAAEENRQLDFSH